VIRRILAEQKEEVSHLLDLAEDLGDAAGRARAMREASELASELADIEASIAPVDAVDSEVLDEAMKRLERTSTRIGILHDALRSATARGTVTMVE
jgi:hypothetical protein